VATAAPALIAIVGPSASGKSALALRLAAEVPAEIVSCDSLQVYRGFDIGSAKATAAERARVPHHMLDVVEPDGEFSAADYSRQARRALREIAGRGRLALVVGGTGLYFRALFRGIFEGPSRDPALRARLERLALRFGDARLHRLLRRADPEAAARITPRDRVRIIRALEVLRATGRPLSDHHRQPPSPLTGFRVLRLGLRPGRERLRAAIEARTQQMLDRGLVEEARALAQAYSPRLRPLRAIGYRQALAVAEGRMGAAEARRQIVRETLRFAKRQMTWFRKEPGIVWHAEAAESLEEARAWLGGSPPSL
jgi:tRNA dimethylallyltransferase